MRPLKLIINAFGPYAGKEEIDFTKIKGSNIFVISGPTGAGKTTIFDAISFALFGEASGTSRTMESLKSHHAKGTDIAYVELEFLAKGKKYKIIRKPTQTVDKVYKNGTIKQIDKKHEAELYLDDETVISRPSEATEKIQQILGLNASQFKQIVMLPQGEFKKLLEAESKDKEPIFRNIFGTERFLSIQKKLDDKSTELRNRVLSEKQRRDAFISKIDPVVNDELRKLINSVDKDVLEIIKLTKALIEKDKSDEKEINTKIEKLNEDKKRIEENRFKAEEDNKKLLLKDRVSNELELLNYKEEEIKKEEVLLEKAKKAKDIIHLEKSVIEAEEKLKDNTTRLESSKKALADSEIIFNVKNKAYEKAELEIKQKDALIKEKLEVEKKLEKFKIYKEKEILVKQLTDELNRQTKNIELLENDLKGDKEKLEKDREIQQSIAENEVLFVRVSNSLREKEALILKAKSVFKKILAYENGIKIYNEEALRVVSLEKKYLMKKEEYENGDLLFRKGLAGILALNLDEGSQCPVCGSTSHPNLAKRQENVPTEEKLKELKDIYEAEKNVYDKALKELAIKKATNDSMLEEGIKAALDEIKDVVNFNGDIKLQFDEMKKAVTESGIELKNEIEELKEEKDKISKVIINKDNVNKEIKALEERIKIEESKIEEAKKRQQNSLGSLTREEGLLAEAKSILPEDIKDDNLLRMQDVKITSKIRELEENLELTKKEFNDIKDTLTKLKQDVVNYTELNERYLDEVGNKKLIFNQKIQESLFKDIDDYNNAKRSDNEINVKDTYIREYYNKLTSKKDEFKRISEETQNMIKVDLKEYDILINEKLNEITLLNKESKEIYSRISNNRSSLRSIEDITTKIQGDEAKYNVIGELAELAKGNNAERITFERYVLAAYFDDIIRAANSRLSKMTNSRYTLKRKESREKGQKQSGLELEVIDAYTGKERHVKTLSGGEGFKASLALALGLADVIQSYAGGVQIDTMFVDEGFGTLDSESLDNAISALMDLQDLGRLVGVISHVPELKERVDARLEITPGKDGSHANFIIK